MKRVLAFDLGASSGRGILAKLENGKLTLEEVHRFENNGVTVRGTVYWDVLYLFDQIKRGMVQAKLAGGFDCVGIDTWGVDFGLIDANGDLIGNPVHYRDARTDGIPEEVFKIIDKEAMYARTGIQILNFNTLFQLYFLAKNRSDDLKRADKMLHMPDLLNYFLTGEKKSEYTISSTGQILDPVKRTWEKELLEELGIPQDILCDMVQPGTVIGNISPEICEELGIEPVPVVAVGSHDTASAVVSVPTQEDDFVYVSCGTWSLFGTELNEPLVSSEALEASYTNEGGYGGTIRFLTNIMGLWLIQESRRTWNRQGNNFSFNDLEKAALACKPFQCFIDPDYPAFGKMGDIPKRIQEYCEKTGQYVPQTVGEIVRCIYESLALKYRHSFLNLQKITGKQFAGIHIVGGGTKDPLLCQMAANAANTVVTAGPIEATALGNIAVQYIAAGEIEDIKQARKIIADSFDVKSYQPQDATAWDKAYERFQKIL
ncbi:MAG: rhamnulokinase [Ruminococcaceae bacterium]|nr:rhamnulokinase [Oscillospiraceae bacterium]